MKFFSELVQLLILQFGNVELKVNSAATNVTNITGVYNLVSIITTSSEPAAVNIPANNSFLLDLVPLATFISDEPSVGEVDEYVVRMQLGNSLLTHMNVTADNSNAKELLSIVNVGQIISTRLLPPPDVQVVETALSTIIPLCTKIWFMVVEGGTSILVLGGESGTVVWAQENSVP